MPSGRDGGLNIVPLFAERASAALPVDSLCRFHPHPNPLAWGERGRWLSQHGLNGLEDYVVRNVTARRSLAGAFKQHPTDSPAA